MPKTVLIVDDNVVIRQALCDLFKKESAFEVCGEAETRMEDRQSRRLNRCDPI